MSEPRVSGDPVEDWRNNDIQFPRLISELEAAGALDTDVLRTVAESMDCTLFDVSQLVDRALDVWDGIKAQIPASERPRKGLN